MTTSQKLQLDFKEVISSLMEAIASETIEIYNEFSLQHELGILLRSKLPPSWKVQFERNISYFEIPPTSCLKREIDIVVFDPTKENKYAFELKFPSNGQYPEQMFKCCQDISFLEQLVQNGFSRGYFLILADDYNFYSGNNPSPIYSYFRATKVLHGSIQKPTGDRNTSCLITGNYKIMWTSLTLKYKFALVEVDKINK